MVSRLPDAVIFPGHMSSYLQSFIDIYNLSLNIIVYCYIKMNLCIELFILYF